MTLKTNSLFSIIRAAKSIALPTFPGANLRASNKPVLQGSYTDGTSSGRLLYWSHADWIDGYDVALHPHKRVEIHTYSWNGETSHYDTSIKAWVPVKAGGMQVLRTGSGMSHAERVGAGCRGFQIWFDPGPEALKRPATYDVYPPSALQPVRNDQGLHVTQYVGGSSPDLIRSEVPGLYIVRYQANEGDVNGVSIKVEKGHSAMLYCLGGNVPLPEALKEAPLAMNDTMALHGGAELYLDLHKGADVFMIKTPLVDQ